MYISIPPSVYYTGYLQLGSTMETTLYIRKDILKKITLAASSRGISRTRMIRSLLAHSMKDTSRPMMPGTMVAYQGASERYDWHRFHMVIRPDEYEYFLDLRKFLKMSVSKILAYSVERYLCDERSINRTDNYPMINYILSREIIDDIICFKLIWGYPQNIKKFGIPSIDYNPAWPT